MIRVQLPRFGRFGAWRDAARHLAAIALPQSLSAETVAFEMLGHVAALARR